jgi:hypoxanthine-guanine phosphoribosyltransferase
MKDRFSKPRMDEDQLRRRLEKVLLRMDKATPSSRSFFMERIHANNFPDWVRSLNTLHNPDEIRNYLYFGFQPLYNALANNWIDAAARKDAVNGLNEIIKISKRFLSQYYTGSRIPKLQKEDIASIGWHVSSLGVRAPYRLKQRNIDTMIHSEDVHGFLKGFLSAIIDRKITSPEYVVGCACGASEPAIALARILDVEVGFMRMSKRQNDDKPVILEEHRAIIGNLVRNRDVVCVEDVIASGKSLAGIMSMSSEYAPNSLLGASVESSAMSLMRPFHKSDNLNLYRLDGTAHNSANTLSPSTTTL